MSIISSARTDLPFSDSYVFQKVEDRKIGTRLTAKATCETGRYCSNSSDEGKGKCGGFRNDSRSLVADTVLNDEDVQAIKFRCSLVHCHAGNTLEIAPAGGTVS